MHKFLVLNLGSKYTFFIFSREDACLVFDMLSPENNSNAPQGILWALSEVREVSVERAVLYR